MAKDIEKKVEEFFETFRLRKYSKGQILILNGDDTDFVFYLIKGHVKEYDVSYRGEEIILNIFKPPAFFPMSLAISHVSNSYIYEAETNVELRQAPANEVVNFLKANPDVMFDLLSRLYRGVEGLKGRMVQLMTGNAKSRLLYELVINCRRFGEEQPDGSIKLPLKENELAARAGLSRETISREIHKLKALKLVSVKPKGIFITDLAAIELKLKNTF